MSRGFLLGSSEEGELSSRSVPRFVFKHRHPYWKTDEAITRLTHLQHPGLNHNLPSAGHQGESRTRERLKEKYYWYGMNRETPELWEAFKKLVAEESVVALGEVGYDQTEPRETWGDQLDRLERLLRCLSKTHVLVLHSRSPHGQPADQSWWTVLYLLKSVPEVGRDRLIHCHCFAGSVQLVDQWLKYFPNTYFGYTGGITGMAHEALEGLNDLEPARLLLETDSPYFGFPPAGFSTSAFLGQTAKAVADIRGKEDWKAVLALALWNTRCLYQQHLPPCHRDQA